ncbi:vesicle-associated membrane protein-associated protein B/C isoform X1 [Drosophila persimilis]|uniref:Vesicle-associated membrane protein-associated protein B/C isoform X1 n=1 Tax=Drosophila pseudoobscura pseudoobscura TaxID=46245 RepID=A0A0R3P5L9_DROPS|nr:vesicle-associated membrane protein-associated protein B/C isoform X1 [Drosophila pseudoobscura]XP_015042118.1 vesicle-associated membrane protein-associated protein B/C isoform X1 [Drosophila pseudoobscura]XP_015042119.1 vesicle-associated membrane protein-associated protein B/C isoform X1 [Drosophila pseudoobscura]XP_015042120.1 vesicle-associated membrane protein-associated protein B/C isoform X1 [Drosophila pseudoobscura]XP_015042121.1 vesicle-associated membrane protein-associated prote
MSKPNYELPLTIDPEHELRFVGPFNRSVVTIMTLRNNSSAPLVFKIKTTAPKRYCVRPNIGKILPFRSTQVEICLQPFMYDQQEKNKHKFMVQSVLAPVDADLTDLNKLWKELEPQQLMDAKLKCVFEMPSAEANAENTSGISVGVGSGSAGGGSAGTNVPAITEGAKSETKLSSDEKVCFVPLSKNIFNPIFVLKTANSTDATEYDLSGEMKALMESNTDLRKENLHLKDQIARYRSSAALKQPNEPYAPVLAEKQIPVFYIAIAIAAAILGLLLGKFLL